MLSGVRKTLCWQKVATDLFTLKGTCYLVVVDYFSRYPEVIQLRSTTSGSVVEALKAIFARHGIPETVVSDNGPQYASEEFAKFAAEYSFSHITSSPHFPQSNGHMERSVQTVKNLLMKLRDPYLAILTYRSTPLPWCGLSPAELLMDQLKPHWPYLKYMQDRAFKHR